MPYTVGNENYYDSTLETLQHRRVVQDHVLDFVLKLIERVRQHDESKLHDPEKSAFDRYTPKLKGCTYGSDEYKQYLKYLEITLKHHYVINSHHPEHYDDGIDEFDLLDLVEMFFDWKSASERHADGNIYKSIEHNGKRFNISNQLCNILINTAKRMGY